MSVCVCERDGERAESVFVCQSVREASGVEKKKSFFFFFFSPVSNPTQPHFPHPTPVFFWGSLSRGPPGGNRESVRWGVRAFRTFGRLLTKKRGVGERVPREWRGGGRAGVEQNKPFPPRVLNTTWPHFPFGWRSWAASGRV